MRVKRITLKYIPYTFSRTVCYVFFLKKRQVSGRAKQKKLALALWMIFEHRIRNDQKGHSHRNLWSFCPHYFETVPRSFALQKSSQPVNRSQLNKDLIYEMRCWFSKMTISWKVFDQFSFYEDWLNRKGKW